MPVTARQAALETLTRVRQRGARPEAALAHHGPEDPRDRALAARIVYGVLQNEMYLDYALGRFAKDLGRLPPTARDILRLSAYQLLFLDRVPARAAVYEGVELARRHVPHAAGAVNAILRALSQSGQVRVEAATPEEALAIRTSHPLWLVRELAGEYGPEVCERILAADNAIPPVTAQTNLLKTTPEALAARLRESGVRAEPLPWMPDALDLAGTGALEELDAFREGLFYVQDPAARLAVTALGVEPGDTVVDVCAAPGGKSFAAAIRMEDRGRIFAFDIHEKKLALIERGAARLGIGILTLRAGDARRVRPELVRRADAVLCDVPCSGFGVIRKKPEIRRKRPEEIARLPEIQLAILRASAEYVRDGGRLVYSTCTILRRENEEVAAAFLRERPDFELMPFTLPGPFGACGGMKTILQSDADTDGFFICVLRKK